MMLSSRCQANETARCRELGALPYVVNPIDPSHLLNTAALVLERMGRDGARGEAGARLGELEREVQRLKSGLVRMVEGATV